MARPALLPRALAALALAALGTYVAGASFAIAGTWLVPESDGAHDLGWMILLDPFVQTVLVVVALAMALPVALLALWSLRGRDLGVGFAFGVGCVTIAAVAGLVVGPGVALGAAALALVGWALACRFARLAWLDAAGPVSRA